MLEVIQSILFVAYLDSYFSRLTYSLSYDYY
ncbi:hypothetical protein FLJU110815_08020 [Flavobacterium jumunjinense]